MSKIILRWPDGVPTTEYSREFLQGMLDRMAVSFHKYGPVSTSVAIDHIKSLEVRLQRYKITGNTEWLMDAANYAMIEFILPNHAAAHFRATDSRESPGHVWVGENRPVSARNDGSDIQAGIEKGAA